jgi:dTDP-4-dehydrorhamnose reductase
MSRLIIIPNTMVENRQNILITGASGQLGSEFFYLSGCMQDNQPVCRAPDNFNLIFVTRKELDIENTLQVADFCKQNKVDVIVNCAAYTAVDKAEEEPSQADAINNLAVKSLANIAKSQNIKLIHISTDYVFDGAAHKPYKESDSTNPKSVHGKTKLDGERALQAINPANSIIIRTSWVYSEFSNNFVKTMLRLGEERDELNVVCDQIGSPTNARDLAGAILKIIPQLSKQKQCDEIEIYHYSNEGVCSWYDFASAIFQINNTDCKVNPIPSEAYPTPAKRPYYSVMDKGKIVKKFDLDIKHWRTSLSQLSLN